MRAAEVDSIVPTVLESMSRRSASGPPFCVCLQFALLIYVGVVTATPGTSPYTRPRGMQRNLLVTQLPRQLMAITRLF